MYKYQINANLKTNIFSDNYQKNVRFIGKIVHYIENVESIDNYYFYSHNQFIRLTEYKDHLNGKIYITDEIMPKFELKEYYGDYEKVYTLPFNSDEPLQCIGLNPDLVPSLKDFVEKYTINTKIYNANFNLDRMFIVTNGEVIINDHKTPIGIICSIPRMRVDEEEFFQNLKIPFVGKSLDEKISSYKKYALEVKVAGNYPEKLENIIK